MMSAMRKLVLISVAVGSAFFFEPVARASFDSFETLMQSAMRRMDREMMIAPTGDPDRDFASMMIPHHQGAVEMAKVELRYGRDQTLRRLAEGIIVEQMQEIAVMQQAGLALKSLRSQPEGSHTTTMDGMQHKN